MNYSGIGGQAVMEGVMMRNKDERYAVAVRKPDGGIEVGVFPYEGLVKNEKIKNIPILRGIINFAESLVLGMKTLTFSASFFEDEEEEAKEKKKHLTKEQEKKREDAMMGVTMVCSVLLAVAVFMALPYYISAFFRRFTDSHLLLTLAEGAVRLLLFVGYAAGIALMPDIKRVYCYHGAEHKCINCIEHGLALNVENVRKSSKEHKRCGTSFLLIVMLISIVFFMFIDVESGMLRILLRLVLVPVIAGVSYEFIRIAGRKDNLLIRLLSAPGMWMQRLTTREPDDAMIEVGIASVEAVFDWRSYVEQIRQEDSEQV